MCSFPGCDRPIHCQKYCDSHYRQLLRGQPLTEIRTFHRHSGETCSVPRCNKPVRQREWCQAHYNRWWRHGDPLAGGASPRPAHLSTDSEIFAHFMPGNPPAEGCWDWLGAVNDSGYGYWENRTADMRHVRAHRVSYQIFKGDLPPDKPYVLHSCDRPICVQPAHLEPGTQPENIRQMVERRRSTYGERNPNAKLTDENILQIRGSDLCQRELADMFGVRRSTINDIRNGKSWQHLL